ncbi:hypothetical protein SM11_pC1739 (plasmid) [Sinorhizobium meliloti SM11]|uniref:Uncharacterized protein n=1 Tax=Sinorhizobium meliloti (strain SM11) TaxID=707241 RepID=F7XDB8_SINMM|nr:hypothetical protein SM11_pC1739 [Sinorhizobium meliloti SM11]GEC38464.1 hypothetical protein EME01_25360 [Sinorhizobium meliloti]
MALRLRKRAADRQLVRVVFTPADLPASVTAKSAEAEAAARRESAEDELPSQTATAAARRNQ